MIYEQPEHVFEAFMDIYERLDSKLFKNITFDRAEGVLEYDSIRGHIVKTFDLTQGTPEVVADVMQWLFSMLDGAANL